MYEVFWTSAQAKVDNRIQNKFAPCRTKCAPKEEGDNYGMTGRNETDGILPNY